jgi:hypothetical protein
MILREEHRFSVSEKEVIRRISEPMPEEISGRNIF